MRSELLELARRLRRRVEQSHTASWNLSPKAPAVLRSPEAAARLEAVAREIAACRRCPLWETRSNSVPGVGPPEARVMFVGEGPGCEEDRRGEPFVGRAGELLDRILESIGLSRGAVFIGNVVKCRPMKDPRTPALRGNDRPPTADEAASCRPYLADQIRIVAPRVIVALGAVAARALLGSDEPIGRIRGQWREYRDGGLVVKLLPTYHPAALLRNPELKKDVWKDVRALKAALEAGAP